MSWIATTEQDRTEMLRAIGAGSVDELFASIPAELRMKTWAMPPGMSEMAVRDAMDKVASKNSGAEVSFLGGGYYDHFIPAAVDALSGRSEFYTAYTPYQPECSQGTLQSIYEYQTAICRLTGMEVANASLYEGGTAVFESATMAVRATGKGKVLCHSSLSPLYRTMLATHAANLPFEQVDWDGADLSALEGAACVIVQNPAFRGSIADYTELAQKCHEKKALLVMSVYPVSLGLLKTPGEMGADIAVAEGQSLGIPLGFGGPYLGIMATRKSLVRKMPGRIVAATADKEGRRGFVLTLQAREQHIRREKAMSNICSNEALMAMRALIHMCLIGKEGLREVAVHCHSKAAYLHGKLMECPGVKDATGGPFFNEFALRLPKDAARVVDAMLSRGFHAGLPMADVGAGEPNELLVAVTEKRTKAQLDGFATAMKEVLCS
jgi:glycine dehydrogenase subunit 1